MAPVEPPELASLLDFAERPRAGDWSLRSALTRYAQPEPERVSAVLALVRRIDTALKALAPVLQRDGARILAAARAADGAAAGPAGVLAAAAVLDRLGDVLAAWAEDPYGQRPDAEVDAAIAEVARRLDALGVPREERARPPRGAGRRG